MITQGATASFIFELGQGTHALATDTLMIALFTASATLGPTTTAYSSTGEVSSVGYTPGGAALTGVTYTQSASGGYLSFANPSWTGVSFTARGALIYNASKANRSVFVLNFGSDKIAGPNFTIKLPANTDSTAVLRLLTK